MVNSLNNILQLKGRFEKRRNESKFGPPRLPADGKVYSKHLLELKMQLEDIKAFWMKHRDIDGALVSVHYTRVVPKSNRLRSLLGDNGKKPTDSICGAKFEMEKDAKGAEIQKHVFTHYVSLTAIEKTISNLKKVVAIIDEDYHGTIIADDIEKIG